MIIEFIIAAGIGSLIGGAITWYLLKTHMKPKTIIIEKPVVKERNVDTTRAVLRGKVMEQLFPLLPDSTYSFSDMRFLGDAVDYIVFDGYSDVKDGLQSDVNSVIFLEIKTGKSRLSTHQNAIRRAIEERRVEWRTIRLP